jgi:hypothetical protein
MPADPRPTGPTWAPRGFFAAIHGQALGPNNPGNLNRSPVPCW